MAYFSRKLLPRETRYEKECLAIKLGVEAFRVYLLGRDFLIQTDHHSLSIRLARWSLVLQEYSFKVVH